MIDQTDHSMDVCCRHGKIRQTEFLEQQPETGKWVCKDSFECKVGLKPNNKKNKKALRMLANNAAAAQQKDGGEENCIKQQCCNDNAINSVVSSERRPTLDPEFIEQNEEAAAGSPPFLSTTTQNPEIQVSPTPFDSFCRRISLYSNDIITSWADEVDREFPVAPDLELHMPSVDFPCTSCTPPPSPLIHWSSSYLSEEGDSSGAAKKLPSSLPPPPADLQQQVRMLQNELTNTKKVLDKTIADLNRLQYNERVMDCIVRNLCSELALAKQDSNNSNVLTRSSSISSTLSTNANDIRQLCCSNQSSFTPPPVFCGILSASTPPRTPCRTPPRTPPRSPHSQWNRPDNSNTSARSSPHYNTTTATTTTTRPCLPRSSSPHPMDNLRISGFGALRCGGGVRVGGESNNNNTRFLSRLSSGNNNACSSLYVESAGASAHCIDSARSQNTTTLTVDTTTTADDDKISSWR
jgi:hypothetical protein